MDFLGSAAKFVFELRVVSVLFMVTAQGIRSLTTSLATG